MKPQIIVIDGPDNSGKSTLINTLLQDQKYKLINFPKSVNGKCISLGTANDKALVETLYPLLDPNFIYILDRGYPSNVVYSGYLRGEMDPEVELADWKRFKEEFDIIEVILTRNHLDIDFQDDLIKLSRHQFNLTITAYEQCFENVFKLLEHDGKNKVISFNDNEFHRLLNYISNKTTA